MKAILKFLKVRLIDHWQTSLVAALLYFGFRMYSQGKIDFNDFKEYLVLIPTIVLLLMKDYKKDDAK